MNLKQHTAIVRLVTLGFASLGMRGAHAQEPVASSEDAVMELEGLNAAGFSATVDEGSIVQENDGLLTIENEQGEYIGALGAQIALSGGETRTIEYEVTDGGFEATYNPR